MVTVRGWAEWVKGIKRKTMIPNSKLPEAPSVLFTIRGSSSWLMLKTVIS
jgi:hypothetical protein